MKTYQDTNNNDYGIEWEIIYNLYNKIYEDSSVITAAELLKNTGWESKYAKIDDYFSAHPRKMFDLIFAFDNCDHENLVQHIKALEEDIEEWTVSVIYGDELFYRDIVTMH